MLPCLLLAAIGRIWRAAAGISPTEEFLAIDHFLGTLHCARGNRSEISVLVGVWVAKLQFTSALTDRLH